MVTVALPFLCPLATAGGMELLLTLPEALLALVLPYDRVGCSCPIASRAQYPMTNSSTCSGLLERIASFNFSTKGATSLRAQSLYSFKLPKFLLGIIISVKYERCV